MKSKEWLDWKKNWPVFVLLILFVPALWWWRIWSSGVLLKWWQGQEGQFVLPTFFLCEEFIALHSHQVIMPETEDIQIDVPNPNQIIVKGIDKQKVGQFAAEVRGKRPPEPYKGKGIKYDYEVIRRKEGKTGAK